MSEPRRMLEGSEDELERQLLRAGTQYVASPELRQKTLAALGVTTAAVGLGAGAGAAFAAAPGAKLGVGSVVAKLGAVKVAALAAGVAIATAIPIALVGSGSRAPEPAARVVPTPAPRSPAQQPARPNTPAPADGLVEPPALPPPALPRPGASVAARPSSAEALRIELAQLDAARGKLKGGRSEEALALLDAYERSTPRGALRLEAEVLRIDALSRSGRMELAKSRARLFLERHPRSVLAARVRRLAGL